MCRTATQESDKVPCSRCGRTANPNDGWEHEWPIYGRLDIGYHSQAFVELAGGDVDAGFQMWEQGHPAMIQDDAQRVVFEWGNGYQYDSTGRYRMCCKCQRELLAVVGRFFGIAPAPTAAGS